MSSFLLNPYIYSAAGGLYDFTTFTFTNAGITGRLGPTLSNCLASYNTASYPWLNDTSYFNVGAGIQFWTVPKTGIYTITAKGAAGGGSSTVVAQMQGNFSLTAGQKLRILVGQMGSTGSSGCGATLGGGGGGTFVMKQAGSTNADIYLIAGGAGGRSADTRTTTYYATTATSGQNGQDGGGAGGTGGNGGAYVSGQCVDNSGGGGGLLTNGGQKAGTSTSGIAFINGGNGGYFVNDYGGSPTVGGFGGGGGTNSYMGGGGGGYSGGGAGGVASCSCTYIGGGGGGGSYNNGTSQSNSTVTNTGHGSVIITFVA